MKSRLILGAAIAALTMGTAGCALLTPTFRTDLTSTMRGATPQLSQCYAAALARNPKLEGAVTVKLTVQRESTALSNVTVVAPQPSDPAFEQCVAQVAGGLNVANAPKLTVKAHYPLTFAPAP